MEREVRLRAEKRSEYRLEQWRQAGEVEQVKTNGTDIRQSGGKAKNLTNFRSEVTELGIRVCLHT